MENHDWRILFVDDDQDDYYLTREKLARVRQGRLHLEWVPSFEQGREALLSGDYDAALVDYDLPGRNGLELLQDVLRAGCETPILMLTGQGNYELDVEAMQSGAADYLSKNELSGALLERSIRYAIERKRASEALEQERMRLRTIIENAPNGILLTDQAGNFIVTNPAVQQIFSGGVTGDASGPTGRYTLHWPNGNLIPSAELPLRRALERGLSDQNIEILVRYDDQSEITVLTNCSPLCNAQGQILGSVAVLTDISERKRVERERERLLEENQRQKELLARIFETSPNGLALVRMPEMRFEMVNAAYRAVLPHPEQDPIGLLVGDVFPLAEGFESATWIQQVNETHQPFSADRIERLYPDGTRRYLSMRILPLNQAPGSPILLITWDTTQIEETYRKAEEGRRILEALLEYIPSGVNIYELKDGELTIKANSRYIERITSQPEQTSVDINIQQQSQTWDIFTEDGAALPPEEWPVAVVARTGEEIHSKPLIVSGPQGMIPILANAGPIRDQAGRITGVITTFNDNSTQKQMEAELRRSEQKMRQVLDTITDSYFVLDRDWRYVDVNEQACRYLEKTREELVGQRIWDLYPAHEHGPLGQSYRQAWETGQPVHFELKSISVPRWAEVHVYPSEEGLAIYWKDITARKRIEEERERLLAEVTEERRRAENLARENQRTAEELRAMLASIADAVIVYDTRGLPIYANPPAITAFGFDPAGHSRETMVERVSIRDGKGNRLTGKDLPLMRALRGETVSGEHFLLQGWHGSVQSIVGSAAPLILDGQLNGVVLVWHDISEHEKLMGQYEAEQARLEAVLQSLPVGVAICDEKGGILLTNQTYEQIWGSPNPEAKSVKDYHAFKAWWAETGQPVQDHEWASAQAARHGHSVLRQFFKIERFDGSQAFILNSAAPIFDAHGRVNGSAVAVMDITDRVKIELALRESEATLRESEGRFRTLADSMPQLVWTASPDGRVDYYNQRIQEYGLAQPEGDSQWDWSLIIHPDDLPQTITAWKHAASTGTVHQVEHRILMSDGSYRWHLSRGLPVRADTGEIIKWYGTATDIHEQKLNEQALSESEKRFHIAIATAPIAVFNQDRDLRYTWIYNPQGGYQNNQVVGKTDMELIPEADGAELFALKRSVLETGKGVKKELRVRLGGEEGSYIVNIEPLFDEEGQVVGITGSSLDVTVERHLEAQQMETLAEVEVHRRLMQQREMERMDIARDLHDGPLQELTAISFAIAEAVEIDQKEERIARLKAVEQMLLKQSQEIRAFCNELRPPTLAPFGLEKAIRSHIEDFKERYPAIQVHLNLTPDKQLLPENTRMALFRIYQEVLNNVGKHSKASELWINLTLEPASVTLEIRDNGIGYKVPRDWAMQARSGHLGLIGMRERASAIGAHIEFDSRPGQGARVRVTVAKPVDEPAERP